MIADHGSEQRDAEGKFLSGNRHQFPPGVSGNPGGRPKGVSPQDALRAMSGLTESEVREIADDPDEPVARRMAANIWIAGLDGKREGTHDRVLGRMDGPIKPEESGEQHEQAPTQVRLVIQGEGVTVKEEEEG